MKRKLLFLFVIALSVITVKAQTIIYDNGPQVNLPGGGFGGADVSHIHDGMNSLGTNHSFALAYRVADDIVIPGGETWVIDSLIFYAYQTQATNNTVSTMLDVNVRIWDGIPGDPGSNIVWGDDITNRMITSEWSGIYRTADFISTTCPPATCNQRAIMRNGTLTGTSLTSGTYWIDWQTNGTLTSGPWCPLLNLGLGITTTGNALQYNSATQLWAALTDTVPANAAQEPQGLPFMVVGSVITGVASVYGNNNVSVSPNPATDKAVVSITTLNKNAVYEFTLYDLLGNIVMEMNNITTNKFDLNKGSLNKGVYFYEVKDANNILKKGKLVFQ